MRRERGGEGLGHLCGDGQQWRNSWKTSPPPPQLIKHAGPGAPLGVHVCVPVRVRVRARECVCVCVRACERDCESPGTLGVGWDPVKPPTACVNSEVKNGACVF